MTKLIKTKTDSLTEIVISQEVTPNLDWMKKTGVASVEDVQKLRDVVESGVSGGDTLTAALNAHISNTNNPHAVTSEMIGAAPSALVDTVAALDLKTTNQITAHVDDKNNPHGVTADKIGASSVGHTHTAQEVSGILTDDMFLAHTENLDNPHEVTPVQIGAVAQAAFDSLNQSVAEHTAAINNPHNVSTEQIGAATKDEVAGIKTDLTTHTENAANPHGVTSVQVGAPSIEEFDQLEENVIAHKEDTNNPHGVTAEQIEASPLVHTHGISDITDNDTLVQYNAFAENRKTIQLDNHDTVSGLTTSGIGANLMMVSKWDVADFGSTQIHANINTADTVTINDDKVVATVDQLPSTDDFITRDTFGTLFDTEMTTAVFPWDSVTGAPTKFVPSAHADTHSNAGSDRITLDASQITSGTIDPSLLPATAVDELVVVANDTERFGLTVDRAQRGDHVKVTETGKLYEIIDDTKLSNEDGYVAYLASVDWVSVTGKPTEFTPIAHTHSLSQISDYVAPVIPTKLPNPNALTIKYNGVEAFVYDGSSAETGNFVVTTETVPGMDAYLKTADADTTFVTKTDVANYQTADQVLAAVTENAVTSISAERVLTSDRVEFKDGDKVLYSLILPYVKFTPQSCFVTNDVASFFADFGPDVTPDTIDQMSWDDVVANKTGIYAKINTVADLGAENGPYLVLLGNSSSDSGIGLHSYVMMLKPVLPSDTALVGDIKAISDRLLVMEKQLTDLKKTNVVPVVMDSAANLNQPDADMVITAASAPIEGTKTVVAKSIDVKSMTASNATIGMTATRDVNVQSVSLTGDLPKDTSNAQLKINTPEYVKITKSTFAQTGYNALEVGLQTAPKNVIIDGLDFTVPLSNNAILIFQHQDDAVITISNCHFADVSNAVRISNKLNKRATVNFINCTIDKWDTRPEWSGFLILQDYSSGSKEAEEANNLFAPDKLTINFINCIGPDGNVINPTNIADVCGTSDMNQIIYIWNSVGGTIPYGDGSRYPTFTFK